MSEKKMAYISTISALEPIEGKDRIVLASFSNMNWRVIVQKDQFSIGDKCIYIETDSILPVCPEFKFLESKCWSERYQGYRIRTMKMGGVISEGICFPIIPFNKQLREYFNINTIDIDTFYIYEYLKEDVDVTDALKIRRTEDEVLEPEVKRSWLENKWSWLVWKLFKYKVPKRGTSGTAFPGYLIKTDETQVQSLSGVFDYMNGKVVYSTLKQDGQSISVALYKGKFTVSTRNRTVYTANIRKAKKELRPSTCGKYLTSCVPVYMVAKLDLARYIDNYKRDICLQGELCGPRIQQNRLGLKEYELFFFNMFDIAERKYYSFETLQHFCYTNGLKTVPFIGIFDFKFKNVQELEEYTSALTYPNGSPAEGVVIRELNKGERWQSEPHRGMHAMCSLKCINPKFKLKTQAE